MDSHTPKQSRRSELNHTSKHLLSINNFRIGLKSFSKECATGKVPLKSEVLEELQEDLGKAFPRTVRVFLDLLPQRMANISEAISQGDDRNLALEAHTLKGSLSMVGAGRLCEIAKELEEMGWSKRMNEAKTLFIPMQIEAKCVEKALQKVIDLSKGITG